MDFGNKNAKREVVKSKEFIDPGFFKIKFSINGKMFEKSVDGILAFESENLDEISDEALDKALDQCSYYRYSFLSAGIELEEKIMKLEREYKAWFARVSETVKTLIMEDRKRQKEELEVPASWFGSITKQDIDNAIMNNDEYREKLLYYENAISEMSATKKLLFGLRDILQDRGGHLQSLGKRRLENRRMSFGVKDVG